MSFGLSNAKDGVAIDKVSLALGLVAVPRTAQRLLSLRRTLDTVITIRRLAFDR